MCLGVDFFGVFLFGIPQIIGFIGLYLCQISENFSNYFFNTFLVSSFFSSLGALMTQIFWYLPPGLWGSIHFFFIHFVSVIHIGWFPLFYLPVPGLFPLSLYSTDKSSDEFFIFIIVFSVLKFPCCPSLELLFLCSHFLLFHLFRVSVKPLSEAFLWCLF